MGFCVVMNLCLQVQRHLKFFVSTYVWTALENADPSPGLPHFSNIVENNFHFAIEWPVMYW